MITVVQTNELRRVNVDVDEQGASITITPQVQETKVEVSIDTLLLTEGFAQQAIISAGQSSQSAILSEASKVASGLSEQNSIAQALISSQKAEESRLSALLAEAQVNITVINVATTIAQALISTNKAGEANQSAIDALTLKNQSEALKNQSETASTTSTQQATASSVSALASEAARVLAEQEKNLATTQAQNSSTSAGQSAGSAAAAEAAKNQIVDKAEINIVTAGNILRSDGAKFKSIPEVELLGNVNAYRKAPDSKFFDNKQIIAWDNFDRANEAAVIQSDSGHTYLPFRSANVGRIVNKLYTSVGAGFASPENGSQISITPTKNIGLEFSFARSTLGGGSAGIALVKDNLNFFYFGRIFGVANTILPEISFSNDYRLIAVINGVATILGSIALGAVYAFGIDDAFQGSRINFVIKYSNRGRNNTSSVLVQSLDSPAARIEVLATIYNSTFVTPADYSRIVIIANNSTPINSYKVANLDL